MVEDDRNLNFEGSSTEAGPKVECFWKWENYSCKFKLRKLILTLCISVLKFCYLHLIVNSDNLSLQLPQISSYAGPDHAQVHTISYAFGVRTVVALGMLVALGGPLREKWLYAQPRDEETSAEMTRKSKDNAFKLAIWEATRRYRRSSWVCFTNY